MARYRIILVDDHVMIRQGIRKIVEDSPQYEVVGEVSDGIELLDLIKRTPADIIVLDISMPHLRGIEAIPEIRKICPEIKVMILTMHKNVEYVYHAIDAGADGYLLKEDTDQELQAALDQICQGRPYISSNLSVEFGGVMTAGGRCGCKPPAENLTARERQVLKLVAEGKTSKEIAALLYISVRTAEHHRANLMRKLKAKSAAEIIKYAIDRGYVA